MPEKRMVWWSILLLAVIAAAFFMLVVVKPAMVPPPPPATALQSPEARPVVAPSSKTYTNVVPADAVLSVSKAEAPASTNPSSGAKARFFSMSATAEGFSPRTITVRRGDTLYIDFTAVDGSYDLSIPYLGASFFPVAKGATRQLPFDVTLGGTFIFECATACPPGGKIQGKLIVLPE